MSTTYCLILERNAEIASIPPSVIEFALKNESILNKISKH